MPTVAGLRASGPSGFGRYTVRGIARPCKGKGPRYHVQNPTRTRHEAHQAESSIAGTGMTAPRGHLARAVSPCTASPSQILPRRTHETLPWAGHGERKHNTTAASREATMCRQRDVRCRVHLSFMSCFDGPLLIHPPDRHHANATGSVFFFSFEKVNRSSANRNSEE